MRKYFFIWWLGLLLPINGFSQKKTYFGTLSLSAEHRTRHGFYTYTVKPFPDDKLGCRESLFDKACALLFSYHYRRVAVEWGWYQKETFYIGWQQKHGFGGGYSIGDFKFKSFRVRYHQPLFKIFRRRLEVVSSIGKIKASGELVRGTWAEFTVWQSGRIILKEYGRVGQEIGLTDKFMLWEGRLQLEYPIFPFFSCYGGVGYAKGTSVIGRYYATFSISGNAEQTVRTESKGTHQMWFVGIRAKIPDRKW